MRVREIAITKPLVEDVKSADELMAYVARVSNPKNQANTKTMPKLLKYCAENKHWSVFEQADLTVEIQTSRAIAQQILRHRSFTFQEFSQRYAVALDKEVYEARRQDKKDRQNSIDDLSEETQVWFRSAQRQIWDTCQGVYEEALKEGIAKECARFVLPLSTQTTIYMKGNVRSWVTYFLVRLTKHTQKEHRDIAFSIWEIFKKHFPIVSESFKELHPEIFI